MLNWLLNLIRKKPDLDGPPLLLEHPRSDKWPTVRKKHLEKEPCCQVCGGTEMLAVHHIIPFHLDRKLELEDTNLITLCQGSHHCNCHLIFGHLLNYSSYNKHVREDVKIWSKKIKDRP